MVELIDISSENSVSEESEEYIICRLCSALVPNLSEDEEDSEDVKNSIEIYNEVHICLQCIEYIKLLIV